MSTVASLFVAIVSLFRLCSCAELEDALTSELIWAASEGDGDQIAEVLRLGAPVNGRDNEAVIMACTAGNLGAVKLLVQHGADVRARDDECLVRAATTPSLDLVKYLVEELHTPVSAQSYASFVDAIDTGHPDIVEYLLSKDASPSRDNALVWWAAYKSGLSAVTNALSKAGGIPHESLLIAGVENSDLGLVQFALQHGASGGAQQGIVMVNAYLMNLTYIGDMLADNVALTGAWWHPEFLDKIGNPVSPALIRILQHPRVSLGGIIRALESAVDRWDSRLLQTILWNLKGDVWYAAACQIALSNNDKLLHGITNGVSGVLLHHLLRTISSKDDIDSDMADALLALPAVVHAIKCQQLNHDADSMAATESDVSHDQGSPVHSASPESARESTSMHTEPLSPAGSLTPSTVPLVPAPYEPPPSELISTEPSSTRALSAAAPPSPLILDGDDEPLYIVKGILDSRYRHGDLQYLIDWEGYPVSERSWEPATNLHGTGGLYRAIADFHARCPQKPGPALKRRRRTKGSGQ
ncbi:hypothetical protein PBRA_004345 [Plasmodiophora brassicae]|uniref:Chromo domain-containing protein n=1 Tax=Plasmodiophora brassicae TaxID=37360 RepID=A0A0G4IKD0_PLABS|nr:hypothetical protein PBRA_004345 [Plasmodiophora brassicae]